MADFVRLPSGRVYNLDRIVSAKWVTQRGVPPYTSDKNMLSVVWGSTSDAIDGAYAADLDFTDGEELMRAIDERIVETTQAREARAMTDRYTIYQQTH